MFLVKCETELTEDGLDREIHLERISNENRIQIRCGPKNKMSWAILSVEQARFLAQSLSALATMAEPTDGELT